MLTPLGKQIRKHRLDKEMTLSQMSEGLGLSPAYISSIETGKRNINSDLLEKIISFLVLDNDEAEKMRDCADQSQNSIKLSLGDACANSRELVAVFARNFSLLNSEQVKKIKEILEK